MLKDPSFVRYLLAAFPPPSGTPTWGADVTHLGPGCVSLAYSMVICSPKRIPWIQCMVPTGTERVLSVGIARLDDSW